MLMPALQNFTSVAFCLYASRPNRGYRVLDALDLPTVPEQPDVCVPPQFAIGLNSFAGQLHFGFKLEIICVCHSQSSFSHQPQSPKRQRTQRVSWHDVQPRGSIKTDQQYRKAMGLPQRYNKAELAWCLDWKQMGRQCTEQGWPRDWTKEELMSYLDWDKAEEYRVEAMVARDGSEYLFWQTRHERHLGDCGSALCGTRGPI